MNIFGVHFHTWTPIFGSYSNLFLSERVPNCYEQFRYCAECGEYQELNYDHWTTLTPEQAIALASRLHSENERLVFRAEGHNHIKDPQ